MVGHGSRGPAAGHVLRALRDAVAIRLAPLHVVLAWIELDTPLLSDVLGRTAGAARPPVVVPLLLSRGTHMSRDLPATATAPLGPDPVLTQILLDRLREAGIAAGRPLVLAATGSADPAGIADVHTQAELLEAAWGAPVRAGFVTAAPSLSSAAATVAGLDHGDPAIVSYFLTGGRLPDSAQADTAHLGGHPALVELVLTRYRGAAPVGVTRMGL